MKDKENQFEELEMAREIHEALLYCKDNIYCRNCEFKNDTPGSFCKAEYIAKAISEKYQPKLPEDSVVLSREERENLYDKGYNNGKQIAEKFYKPLVKAETSKEMAEKIWFYLERFISLTKEDYDYRVRKIMCGEYEDD